MSNGDKHWQEDKPATVEQALELLRYGGVQNPITKALDGQFDMARTERRMLACADFFEKASSSRPSLAAPGETAWMVERQVDGRPAWLTAAVEDRFDHDPNKGHRFKTRADAEWHSRKMKNVIVTDHAWIGRDAEPDRFGRMCASVRHFIKKARANDLSEVLIQEMEMEVEAVEPQLWSSVRSPLAAPGGIPLDAEFEHEAPDTPGTWQERCAALYQVIGGMADHFGIFESSDDVSAALDVAAGRGDVDKLLPWPKAWPSHSATPEKLAEYQPADFVCLAATRCKVPCGKRGCHVPSPPSTPATPGYGTSRCKQHGGYGFSSDCEICSPASPSAIVTTKEK